MGQEKLGVPQGFHTLTPYLIVDDAPRAIEFYKRAFDAEEIFRWTDGEGRIRHAEIKIGDSPLMLVGEISNFPSMKSAKTLGGSPVHMFLYVEDAVALGEKLMAVGMTEVMPVEQHDDGDKRGGFQDPFGIIWWVATQTEDISRDELQKRYTSKVGQ